MAIQALEPRLYLTDLVLKAQAFYFQIRLILALLDLFQLLYLGLYALVLNYKLNIVWLRVTYDLTN